MREHVSAVQGPNGLSRPFWWPIERVPQAETVPQPPGPSLSRYCLPGMLVSPKQLKPCPAPLLLVEMLLLPPTDAHSSRHSQQLFGPQLAHAVCSTATNNMLAVQPRRWSRAPDAPHKQRQTCLYRQARATSFSRLKSATWQLLFNPRCCCLLACHRLYTL